MKRKHLIILVCIVAILGILYAIQQNGRGNTTAVTGTRELVPAEFSSDAVATVRFKRAGELVTLKQTDAGWVVEERYGYPADFEKLRELFFSLCEARVAQSLNLTRQQAEELLLTQEKGTTMTLEDKEGKTLQRFLFGVEHGNAPDPSMPFDGTGKSRGRYLQLADGRNVVVPEPFREIDTPVTGWLDNDFFQISDLKRAELKRDGETEWELVFKDGESTLTGPLPEGREFDESKASALRNAFSWLRFTDVADPDADPKSTGMDQAPELCLTDSDDLVYTLRPGAGADGKYFLRVTVAWAGEEERQAPAGEKPEDRERLDAEYAETIRRRKEKAGKLNRTLSPWTYAVGKSLFDSATGTRESFLKEKPKPEASPAPSPPAAEQK